MISHKAPAGRWDIQNEKYLSAILDILDEEMDFLAPNQGTEDQSDELDSLVADFLKQLAPGPGDREVRLLLLRNGELLSEDRSAPDL